MLISKDFGDHLHKRTGVTLQGIIDAKEMSAMESGSASRVAPRSPS